ncbi:MAG TPA: hypothetical protein VGG39_09420 [Polyangiaceae bacterium]
MTSRARTAVRAAGVAAAAVWAFLALTERGAWPVAGLFALGGALALGLLARPVTSLVPRLVLAAPRPAFVGACAVAAAAISWWVVARTLHDRPLSIDAGIYLFQARTLAHGHFGMPEPLPAQAFGDRFLLDGPDGRLHGIFPPGWPLALVPFVWIGRPMLAGPVIAVGLVFAQARLGRTLARRAGDVSGGELATRVSLLLALPSIGRALETADLLSHAFVALLACVAVVAALDDAMPVRRRAVIVGACVGWVLAARLLDGVVLGAVVVVAFAWTRPGLRALGWCVAGAAPFVVLLVLEQRAATGAWFLPTQTAYFTRSDWPSTCHRLGFGPDVGCTVEHPGPVARLGGHGYGLPQALSIARERAGSVGEELVGFAPLLLLAFVPVAVAASAADAAAVAFVLGLTLAYGLFYYGNALFFGARHLFPVAPFAWVLVARGALAAPHRERGWLDARHAAGAASVALLVAAIVAGRAPWKERLDGAAAFQAPRSDLRRSFAKNFVERGILKTRDYTSFAAAFDSWPADQRLVYALDDGSGLLELRRAHPDVPMFLSLPGDDLGRFYAARPPAGVLVELETAWPAFVRPSGLAARQLPLDSASGGHVLLLSHASPGGQVILPFDIAIAGTYAVEVDGFQGPDQGDYELALDGEPMALWRGYAPALATEHTTPVTRSLASGRHVLVARCTGHDTRSADYDARLDAFVGR